MNDMTMGRAPQTGGNNPAFLGRNSIRISGNGGKAGAGPQFAAPFTPIEGRDGGVVIYEDIG